MLRYYRFLGTGAVLEDDSGQCQNEKERNEQTGMPPWRYCFGTQRIRAGTG
jgi:hypothetical protein